MKRIPFLKKTKRKYREFSEVVLCIRSETKIRVSHALRNLSLPCDTPQSSLRVDFQMKKKAISTITSRFSSPRARIFFLSSLFILFVLLQFNEAGRDSLLFIIRLRPPAGGATRVINRYFIKSQQVSIHYQRASERYLRGSFEKSNDPPKDQFLLLSFLLAFLHTLRPRYAAREDRVMPFSVFDKCICLRRERTRSGSARDDVESQCQCLETGNLACTSRLSCCH